MSLSKSKVSKDTEEYQDEYDYDLQQAIQLSLNPRYITPLPSHNSYVAVSDTLLFNECTLLMHGFISKCNYNIPTALIHVCSTYFHVGISITALKERRKTALQLNDTFSVFEIEKLILHTICGAEYNKSNKEMLEVVITHWKVNDIVDTYNEYIIQCIYRCIGKDNVHILQFMLRCLYNHVYDDENELDSWNKSRRMKEMIEFINYAAKRGTFECMAVLLQNPLEIDWCGQLRPEVLFNAVKYQHDDIKFIHFIIDCMEITGIKFICDDVMEEIIRYDVIEIGKRIVTNRWHKITDDDISFAKFKNLQCHKWITQRINVCNYYRYYVENNDVMYDECVYDEWKD